MAEDGGPAMRALGSLLKLTEVFLWDDGTRYDRSFSQGRTKPAEDDGDDGSNAFSSECGNLPEDMELTRQMNELGLPVSFQTNKQKQKGKTEGKRKGMRMKHPDTCQDVVGEALDSSKVSVEESVSPIIFDDNPSSSLCCMSMMGQSESSCSHVAVDASKLQCPFGMGDTPVSLIEITRDSAEEQCDGTLGIVSDDGRDFDSLHNSAVVTDATSILASSTGLEAVLDSSSCSSDAANGHVKMEPDEILLEHDHSIIASHDWSLSITGEDHVPEQPYVSKSISYSMSLEVLDYDGINGQESGDFGDWMVCWDYYYMRSYFYNSKTHTSTWYPPEGMEHLGMVDTTYKSNEGVAEVTQVDVTTEPNEVRSTSEEIPKYREHDEAIQKLNSCSMFNSCTGEIEDCNMHSQTGVPATNGLEMKSDCTVVKRKKKVRRIRSRRKFFYENEDLLSEGLLKECSADIGKYWCQRYQLFSRYDDGIKMDEEGWFSVTPEALARHHAQRCGSGIIIDCFTGVGGNAIQFAQISKHVTAIDIDPTKIDYAQHNAAIYGVDERIDFLKGDFFHLASRLKADTVFLSPPWGGPDYAREETYDIAMLKPHDGCFLFNTAKRVASKIVMFLPRNVDINQLAELSLSGTPPWSLEVEKNYVNGKLKGITAYFSDTARRE